MKLNKQTVKGATRTLFFLLLGVGIVVWFWAKLSSEEKAQMWQAVTQTRIVPLVLAAVATLASHYVRAVRWQQLGEAIGCKVSRKCSFLAVMSGYLTNLAVPRLGEVVRCAMIKRESGVAIEKTLGTIITERAADFVLFLCLLAFTLLVQVDVFSAYVTKNFNLDATFYARLLLVCLGLGVVVLAAFWIFRKRIRKTGAYKLCAKLLKGLLEGIKSIFKLKHPWLFIAFSVLIWGLWVAGTFCCFYALKKTSHLNALQALVTTVMGAFGPMITPGGIGLQPAIFAEVLHSYRVALPIGYGCGWLNWMVSQLATILVGLYAFVYFSHIKKNAKR